MNKNKGSESDNLRSLQILDELSGNDSMTQRELSGRLGIALGLVNSYIKNLVKKGFITVKSIPPKRYTYYLTPKGFSEKTRLTFALLQDYNRVYREARENVKRLFAELHRDGLKKIIFAGADEVAEIAYITLQETGLELAGVIDDTMAGKQFFGTDIKPVRAVKDLPYDCIVLTAHAGRDDIFNGLVNAGVAHDAIKVIFMK